MALCNVNIGKVSSIHTGGNLFKLVSWPRLFRLVIVNIILKYYHTQTVMFPIDCTFRDYHSLQFFDNLSFRSPDCFWVLTGHLILCYIDVVSSAFSASWPECRVSSSEKFSL